MSPTNNTAELLNLNEVAEKLDVHYMTAYRYVRLGMLPATQQGRSWVVRSDDLDSFMGEEAVKVGLADTVARPSEAFAAFVEMF